MPLAAILYARSGVMRAAFEAVGWDAVEVDILPGQRPGAHWQGDAFAFLDTPLFAQASIVVWHPVCTYVCGSGYHWNSVVPGRNLMTGRSLDQIGRMRRALCEIPFVMENPIGIITERLNWPGQTVQPYMFGDDASKATVLRMNLLPELVTPPPRSQWHPGRIVEMETSLGVQRVRRWANQTDSGQNKLSPSEDRWADRSETYPGIAKAIAVQMTRALEFGCDLFHHHQRKALP